PPLLQTQGKPSVTHHEPFLVSPDEQQSLRPKHPETPPGKASAAHFYHQQALLLSEEQQRMTERESLGQRALQNSDPPPLTFQGFPEPSKSPFRSLALY